MIFVGFFRSKIFACGIVARPRHLFIIEGVGRLPLFKHVGQVFDVCAARIYHAVALIVGRYKEVKVGRAGCVLPCFPVPAKFHAPAINAAHVVRFVAHPSVAAQQGRIDDGISGELCVGGKAYLVARRGPVEPCLYLAHAFGADVVVAFLPRNKQRPIGRHALHLVVSEGIGGVRQPARLAIGRAYFCFLHVVSHA